MGFRVDARYPALQAMMKRIGVGEEFRQGLRAGTERFKEGLAKQPPDSAAHHAAIWSDDPEKRARQLRGFFYYLKTGAITVPYKRSGRLGAGWRVRVVGLYTFEARNDTKYAALVQGVRKRTRYHTITGHKTPPEVWERDERAIKQAIGRGVSAMIRKGSFDG